MSNESSRPKARRGFAAMSPEKRREIASRGGKKAHEMGVAHTFTRESAIEAGSKGGAAFHRKRGRTVIVDHEGNVVDISEGVQQPLPLPEG